MNKASESNEDANLKHDDDHLQGDLNPHLHLRHLLPQLVHLPPDLTPQLSLPPPSLCLHLLSHLSIERLLKQNSTSLLHLSQIASAFPPRLTLLKSQQSPL